MLVTHDPMLADYATRRIVLRDGLIVSDERSPTRPEPALSASAAVPVGG